MKRKQSGFTLVELMVTMVIFVLVIAAASSMFAGVLNQFKQQSKIAETNIEGNIGLQMLRTDIEQAGYGLPWNLDGVGYDEASVATAYNDSTNAPPRAFVMSDGDGFNASDILVVKATNVAMNEASHKWAYISNTGANNIMRSWAGASGTAIADENLENNDRVIALRTAIGSNQQVLVQSGGVFSARFNSSLATFSDNFEPVANSYETYILYGVTSPADPVTTPLRMPFNRADYYISDFNPPSRCAPNTGVLVKSLISHSNGARSGGLPLLDCVADMQIVLGLDMNDDEAAGTYVSPGASDLTSTEGATATTVQATFGDASLLREQVKEVRVYILAHEGQRDTFYTHSNATIEITDQNLGVLKTFDFSDPNGDGNTADAIANWQNYRWKTYTILVKPFNLR